MVDNYFHDEVIAQQLAIFRETLGFGATKILQRPIYAEKH